MARIAEIVKRLKAEAEAQFTVDGVIIDPNQLIVESIEDSEISTPNLRPINTGTGPTVNNSTRDRIVNRDSTDSPARQTDNPSQGFATGANKETTKRGRAREKDLVRERDEKRRQERRERNRDHSVCSASPDSADERFVNEDARTRLRKATRDLRRDLREITVNGKEVKCFDRREIPITSLLATVKRLFTQYNDDIDSNAFLLELGFALFNQLDMVWINKFIKEHPDSEWTEIEQGFIQAFRSPDHWF